MIVYGSNDIGDVFVKPECRVHSYTAVFDMVGIDDRLWSGRNSYFYLVKVFFCLYQFASR